MKIYNENHIRKGEDSERGQALVLIPTLLVALIAAASLVIDMGNLYLCEEELQVATTAAAAAGANSIPQGNNLWQTAAYQYSGWSSAPGVSPVYNTRPNLAVTSVTPSLACVQPSMYAGLGLSPCSTYPGNTNASCNSSTGCNVIQVVEKASVSTFFARLFGVRSLNISATATASAKGGGPIPYNVILVLDTTNSMGSGTDTGCDPSNPSAGYSPEQCAQMGIQTLLSRLAPCGTSFASCGSNPAVDQVGLMAFPGLCSSTSTGITTANCPAATTLTNTTANSTYASDAYQCPAVNPPIATYNNNPEYLILGFQNNYRLSDTAALNTSSPLFEAVGAGTNHCGMATPGGEGTFYAGVITAAQAYLANHPTTGAQNVMILLSDGNASASSTQMGGSVKQLSGSVYPTTAQCQQAVTAAAAAKAAGTLIYSVSYGSETSGCSTGDTLTPCGTMSAIASTPLTQYFFSVPQTVNGVTTTVCSGAAPITTLSQVFTDISGDLGSSRLIPNSVF